MAESKHLKGAYIWIHLNGELCIYTDGFSKSGLHFEHSKSSLDHSCSICGCEISKWLMQKDETH